MLKLKADHFITLLFLDSSEGWDDCISDEERVHHELLFYSQGPVDGYLTGELGLLYLH